MSTEAEKIPMQSELAKLQTDDSNALVAEARRSQFIREERLNFPPVYVAVGVYRLFTDKNLYVPVWAKCKHGVVRGAVVGLSWAFLTFNIQRKFVEVFLRNSPRVTGLSHDTIFGYTLPFTVTTYATILFVSEQITYVLRFFLSKNIRIARDRAWDQTVASRGKGPEFWQPYIEEYAVPPKVSGWNWERWVGNSVLRMVITRGILLPLNFYPFVGVAVGAYFKSVNTARYLHDKYFKAKRMTKEQIAIFMEERNWRYRAFGFAAALLESIPIIGLAFTISNRIGAAMWAHDLEKQQHAFASGEKKPIQPSPLLTDVDTNEPSMAGSWQDKKEL